MCKNWREKGVCKYGDKCLFAHGDKELTKRQVETTPAPVKEPSKEETYSRTQEKEQSPLRKNSLTP
jgi:hypothetical protein